MNKQYNELKLKLDAYKEYTTSHRQLVYGEAGTDVQKMQGVEVKTSPHAPGTIISNVYSIKQLFVCQNISD